jgi:protein-L-isoaspartate(D-aspartate) O-methyltransferase
MVDAVQERGAAQRPAVEAAMRKVPRHLFVPDADLRSAYDPDSSVITHWFEDGTALSCASGPWVVGLMLDQLDVRPGQRILEIGAGTGYNAALLAELAGDPALVTTIDINSDVTARARRALKSAGYQQVRVFTGDGALGDPEHGTFDRIIATVSPWEVPEPWWDQLAAGGRLVTPLRWRGQYRGLAFTKHGDALVADSNQMYGFVYLLGDIEGERSGQIVDDVRLHWDQDQTIDPANLSGALSTPRVAAWSGESIGPEESIETLWMKMSALDPRVCRLDVTAGTSRDLIDPIIPMRTPALVDGSSIAYLTIRRPDGDAGEDTWELGAYGHGPDGLGLATAIVSAVRRWSPVREQIPGVTLLRRAAGTAPDNVGGTTVIDKGGNHLVLTYQR